MLDKCVRAGGAGAREVGGSAWTVCGKWGVFAQNTHRTGCIWVRAPGVSGAEARRNLTLNSADQYGVLHWVIILCKVYFFNKNNDSKYKCSTWTGPNLFVCSLPLCLWSPEKDQVFARTNLLFPISLSSSGTVGKRWYLFIQQIHVAYHVQPGAVIETSCSWGEQCMSVGVCVVHPDRLLEVLVDRGGSGFKCRA